MSTATTHARTGLGERLDELCVEHDLSYAELARRLEVNRTTLYHLMTDRHPLPTPLVTLVMLADQFGVSTDWLLGRTSERRPPG